MRRLGPYAEGPDPAGLVLSLDPELSHARHLESSHQSSDSYFFGDSEGTLETIPMPSSSPPLMALAMPSVDTIDDMQVDYDDGSGDTDVDDTCDTTMSTDPYATFRAPRATSFNSVSFNSGPREGDPTKIIRDVIDYSGQIALLSGIQSVDLSNFGLTEIPAELVDIRNLVCIEDPRKEMVNLNLSNNLLRFVPEALYSVNNIRVLSFRNNQLTELSPLIRNLTKLTELTVSNNALTTLPIELWTPDHPILITALGNNFLPVPKHLSAADLAGAPTKVIDNGTPTLLELAQRAMLLHPEADKFCQRPLADVIPDRLLTHIRRTHDALRCGRRCSNCSQPLVEPSVVYIAWHQSSGGTIPFSGNFCTQACYGKFFLARGLAVEQL